MGNEAKIKRAGDDARPGLAMSAAASMRPVDGALTLALDAEHAELRLLIDNSIDILCRHAPDGTILFVSPACRSILGFEPGQLVGRNKAEFVHPEDQLIMLPDLTKAPPTRDGDLGDDLHAPHADQHFAEYRLQRSDGRFIWAQTTSRLIRDENAQIRQIIAVVRDVTQRKQTEENLRHSERLASIGTLAAGIAHEINNPLGAILMAAHAAREFNRKPGQQAGAEEMITQIMADARRAAQIVRSVLQFARQEQSERVPVSIRQIVMQVRHHALRYAGARPVDIKVRGPDVSPWVMVSPIEIEQTLVNLVINSIDAGATRVHVTVRADQPPGRVTVSVIDNGKGMSSEQIKHAFDPFYTGRSHAGGTGLGLSIAQGIVVAHGGAIALSSQPSRGTTVTFDLPMTAAQEEEKSGA